MASKRRDEHTVADILRLKPKWFLEKQSDTPDALKALLHVHTLMEYGQNHIAEAPFIEVFKDYDVSFKPEAYSSINKLIATYTPVRKRTSTISNPVIRTTRFSMLSKEAFREALRPDKSQYELELSHKESELRRIQEDINSLQRNVREYTQSLHTTARRAPVVSALIDSLQEKIDSDVTLVDPERLRLLKAVPEQWCLVRTTSTEFTIIRRQPITLRYIGASGSGMAQTLYMGYFGFTFGYDLHCLESFPVADYIGGTSSLHPHVSGSSICWGNIAHKAEAARNVRDYETFFALFESILTTYCPDNPYVSFSDFVRRKNTSYKVFNTRSSELWYIRKSPEILTMIAETASDEFLREMPEIRKQALSRANNEYRDGDNSKLIKYLGKLETVLASAEVRNKLNGLMADRFPNGVWGAPFLALLKECGIHLPPRDIMLRTKLGSSSVPDSILKLLIIAHEGIPVFFNGTNFRYLWIGDSSHKYYFESKQENTSGINFRVMGSNLGGRGTTITSAGYGTLRFPDDMAMDAMIPERYRPRSTPLVVPAAPTPTETEEEVEDFPEAEMTPEEVCQEEGHDWNDSGVCRRCREECEHDDFDSSGYCERCSYYDADHDTRDHDED